MDISIENKSLDLEINVSKVYPELEGLEITPSGVEQNFKSSKYGYDNVKVKAVASDDLEITPTLEEQNYVGLYGKVNVNPATEVYNNAYNEGKNSVIDFARYASTFSLATTEGLPETVTFNFDYIENLTSFYRNKENLTVKHFILNCAQPLTNIEYLFSNTAQTNVVEHITLNADTSQVKRWTQVFYMKRNLRIIDGEPLNLSSATYQYTPFGSSTKLEEVRFVKESIPLSLSLESSSLSAKSVQSIIDGLKDYSEDTSGTSPTLTLHKDVKAKLTDEQIASITSKNWNLA